MRQRIPLRTECFALLSDLVLQGVHRACVRFFVHIRIRRGQIAAEFCQRAVGCRDVIPLLRHRALQLRHRCRVSLFTHRIVCRPEAVLQRGGPRADAAERIALLANRGGQ